MKMSIVSHYYICKYIYIHVYIYYEKYACTRQLCMMAISKCYVKIDFLRIYYII